MPEALSDNQVSHARRGYGTGQFLELGRLRKVPVSGRVSRLLRRRGPRDPKGEAGVMIEWSWRVELGRSVAVGSWSTERRINAAIHGLIGPKISEISVVRFPRY